jgi:hypothetical protein
MIEHHITLSAPAEAPKLGEKLVSLHLIFLILVELYDAVCKQIGVVVSV